MGHGPSVPGGLHRAGSMGHRSGFQGSRDKHAEEGAGGESERGFWAHAEGPDSGGLSSTSGWVLNIITGVLRSGRWREL